MPKISSDKKKIEEILTRAVDEVIVEEHLRKRLSSGDKLRIKFGIDPTAPDIHLGHTVSLRKLQQFQELGHQAVLIIGDFTATVGDPSGRNEMRKQLTDAEIKLNLKTYLKQAGKVLDLEKVEIHYNGEWFKKADALKLYELTSKVSIQRAMERDDFQKRIAEGRDVSMLEIIYPLLQGYDSVMVKADVEIGGRDQKFNLLMGRRVQRAYDMAEQNIMTTWLIEGTDGVRKMSKSFGNYIGVTEPPESMYGKIMSIPDDLIVKYFRALTDVPNEEVDEMLKLSRTMGSSWDPRSAKARLAREVVSIYHDKKAGAGAEEEFDRVFKSKGLPEDIKEIKLTKSNLNILDLLVETKLVASRGEARRVVEQGGVKADGKVVSDINALMEIKKDGMLIQKGKKTFLKVFSK